MGGKNCVVIGCAHRTVRDKNVHFYKFPQDQTLREVWVTFSRRGSDFEIKKSTVMCQEHFDPSCYVYKKKQQCIAKGSIPTIFFRDTPEGREKIILTFDRDVLHYVEEDTLLNPAFDREKREAELVAKRERKLNEIKKLCRFCFEEYEDNKLISIAKFKDYGISPNEMLTLIGINTEHNDMFSKTSCEECFQQIITFDGYRRRCQKVQNALISDIKGLDESIQKLTKNGSCEPFSWFKPEAMWNDEDDESDEDYFQNTSTSPFKKEQAEPSFQEIIIKEEKEDAMSDEDFDNFNIPSIDLHSVEDHSFDDRNVNSSDEEIEDDQDDDVANKGNKKRSKRKSNKKEKKSSSKKSESKYSKKLSKKSVIKEEPTIHEASKNSEMKAPPPKSGRLHNQRTYECFFCHGKYEGKIAYTSHACQVKELICEVEGCMKTFTALSGFNVHISKLHKLPKITRYFCPICKLSSVFSEEDFKEHSRTCEKTVDKKIAESSVTCEICGKFCPTNKSYAVHMMFHKISEPFKPSPIKTYKAKYSGSFMCESCGKEFATPRYLKDHVARLHTEIDQNQPTFTCDHCGKTTRTRYAINKHIRNVHTVNPVACKVCRKIFRNKTLVQAHMLYHKENKRIHFCTLCPEKPPYWTAVALKRHQESNHGYGVGYQCELCSSHYRTKQGLVQHKTAAHGIARRLQCYSKINFQQSYESSDLV